MTHSSLFHLAFPVDDLEAARRFYGGVLGCPEGRSSEHWIDFNFHGHQIVAHRAHGRAQSVAHADVNHTAVPVPHFGLILSMPQWRTMAERLRVAEVLFIVEPHIRFEGRVGEQATMFFLDPAGNALEIKAFDDITQVFAH